MIKEYMQEIIQTEQKQFSREELRERIAHWVGSEHVPKQFSLLQTQPISTGLITTTLSSSVKYLI